MIYKTSFYSLKQDFGKFCQNLGLAKLLCIDQSTFKFGFHMKLLLTQVRGTGSSRGFDLSALGILAA